MGVFKIGLFSSAIFGLLMSETYAQGCNPLVLYSGQAEIGLVYKVGESSMPESPEMAANWGEKDGMLPPYIRFSGQTNETRSWVGTFSFPQAVKIIGEGASFQVHSLAQVNLSVAYTTQGGVSQKVSSVLNPNQTLAFSTGMGSFGLKAGDIVSGVVFTLENVAPWQYVTLFFDELQFSCAEYVPASIPPEDAHPAQELLNEFTYSNIDPSEPTRETGDVAFVPAYAYVIKPSDVIILQKGLSTTKIVVSVQEGAELEESLSLVPETAEASVSLWRSNLHTLSRNRLEDSVLANPSVVLRNADLLATSNNHQLIPLVAADVDYEVLPCDPGVDSAGTDTPISCEGEPWGTKRYSHVAFPVKQVNGSKIALVFDPAYMITNRNEALPMVSVLNNGNWVDIGSGSGTLLEFPHAGVNVVHLQFKRNGYIRENSVLVEVQ